MARWKPVVGAFESDMLDVSVFELHAAFLIPAADRRISATLQRSVVASRSGLVDCADFDEEADVSWVPPGAFGFVSSFEFMLFEGLVEDDESPALPGARLSFPDTDSAGGSPVAALKVERSDWKLIVAKMGVCLTVCLRG